MKILNKLQGLGKASKALIVGAGAALLSTSANAAITYDSATSSFTGDFDLTPYYSAIGIVVVAVAIVASIKLAFSTFRRV